jgi:hypothetical protein
MGRPRCILDDKNDMDVPKRQFRVCVCLSNASRRAVAKIMTLITTRPFNPALVLLIHNGRGTF